MTLRPWILAVALAAFPSSLAAQALDSLRAHDLALQMAKDIQSLEYLSDLRFITYSLPAIEAFFGIEFELPDAQETEQYRTRAKLEVIHGEYGAGALLDEAARLDEERGYGLVKRLALEMIARQEGPGPALVAARERDLLDSHFGSVVSGAGLRRIDEVFSWIASSDLDPDMRLSFRTQALSFGTLYEPFRFWQLADSLPEPHRTRVRAQAMVSNRIADSIPLAVLEAALPTVERVALTLQPDESRGILRAVSVACGRRPMEVCEDLDLPDPSTFRAATDVINLLGSGAFEQATRRLEQLRRTEPPLAVARRMAQGLEALGKNCVSQGCDLVRIDSLASQWLGEILSAEAHAMAGRIERTATWNGEDDLTELQRALGHYFSGRDLKAVREILGRLEDDVAVGRVLMHMIQVAPQVDLIGAVEIYLDFAPEGSEPIRVHYADLLRAGRPDLAERMIAMASPRNAVRARLEWVYRLTSAWRVPEAREVVRTVMSDSDFSSPVGSGRLLGTLESLRMLDEYLALLRALPTPLERLNGIYPLVSGWVQEQNARRRSGLVHGEVAIPPGVVRVLASVQPFIGWMP